MKVEEWKKLYERARITEFLPYFQYEDGIYFLRDGGMGFIFECAPLGGVEKGVYTSLVDFLKLMPEGASVQFTVFASPDITEPLRLFTFDKAEMMKEDLLSRDVVEEYESFLESKTREIISEGFPLPVRRYRLLVSVKLEAKSKVVSFFEGLLSKIVGAKETEGFERVEKLYEQVQELRRKSQAFLSSVFGAFGVRECSPDLLIDILYPFFHMGRDFRNKPSWDGADIADCLVENDFKLEVREDCFILDESAYVKSLCMKEYPKEWSAADSFFYTGNPINGKGIGVPYMLSLNAIRLPNSEAGKVRTRASLVLSQRLSYSLFPRLRLKHQDLTYAMERIEDGESIWYVHLSLLVFGRDLDDMNRGIADAKKHFGELGFRVEEDKYINHAVFLSSLPLGYDLETHKFLGRGRAVFLENVADLAPIYADGVYTSEKAVIPVLTPRGSLLFLDLFFSPTGGYNGFVVATTGAGKSVWLQWIALMYYLAGYNVRIIDIGGSYERFCKNFGGTYISVSYQNPMSVNPFSLIKSEDELVDYMEFLQSLLLLMGGSKDRQTFAQQEKILRSYLEEAIRESYGKYGQESNIDTIVDALKKILERKGVSDPRVEDFIVSLRPYTSEGSYGMFFNSPSEVDLSNQIVVIDNTFVESMPELMNPLLMVFTFHVSREVYVPKKKGKGTVCMIDEAHKFLGNPNIDVFVEQAYRRFRKDGASMIMATQGFNDFMGEGSLSRAGRAAVENSFWQMFMVQNSASRNALRNEKRITLTEWEDRLMDSTRTLKGEFSEVFIKTESFTLKVRLVLNDFLKAMFFTDAQVRRRVQELVEGGLSYREAVKRIQEEMRL